MKHIIISLSLFLAAGMLLQAGAQEKEYYKMNPEVVRLLEEDHTRIGNNTNSYEYRPAAESPAPKGYKPVYVSHYGRHGSRSNWGSKNYDALIAQLTEAKEAGILTADGEVLLKGAKDVLAHYDGMDGRLTPLGVREHAQIAGRLCERVPAVFKGKRTVRCIASTVQRSIISMCGFTNELARRNPKLTITMDCGAKFQEYINAKGNDIGVDRDILDRMIEERNSREEDTMYVLNLLFTDPVRGHEIVGDVHTLYNNIFATAQVTDDFEMEEDLFRFMPISASYKRWSYYNHLMYYHNANSAEHGRRHVPCAESLANDIITKADEALERGDIAADLRFGHDYPILSLVSYLGIEGVGDVLSYDEVDYKWYCFWNVCMGSNLQIIFYRNKAGETLVKFLYQERETKLRKLEPDVAPCYYKWDNVKANIKGYLR